MQVSYELRAWVADQIQYPATTRLPAGLLLYACSSRHLYATSLHYTATL